jgi:membrane dipeptidase
MMMTGMRGKTVLLIVFFVLAAGITGFIAGRDSRKLHADAIVIDMHNDVVQRMIQGEDISKPTSHGHSDLPRFRDGGVDVEFFSIWVPPGKTKPSYYKQANLQIDTLEAFVQRYPSLAGIATTASDVERMITNKTFVIMLGLEGGHSIEDDTNKLKELRHRGVRYMTLTWNNSTTWATSASDEEGKLAKSRKKGLTPFGMQVVKLMNRIGMIIDASHAGERTFWDVVKTSTKPVIVSHSSVWSLCKNRRNLKDDQIRAIAKSGGVVCVNFAPQFLDSTFVEKEKRMLKQQQSQIDSLKFLFAGNSIRCDSIIEELKKRNYESIRPPLSLLVDHFEYVVKLVGADHVGIGSDFDGIGLTPRGMDDVASLPALTDALVKHGYSDDDIKKILGGNILRILHDADAK